MRSWLTLSLLIMVSGSFAQQIVEVRNEPRHVPVFQNKQVRLLDALIKPGDTSLYHIHSLPSIFVFICKTNTAQQPLGKEPVIAMTYSGQTWYRDFKDGAVTHRVWSADTNAVHAFDIELIGKAKQGLSAALQAPGVELLEQVDRARIYRIRLLPGGETELELQSYSGMLIPYLGGVELDGQRIVTVQTGSYLWLEKKKAFLLRNKGTAIAEAYFYEIF